jgi:hypothetical protein
MATVSLDAFQQEILEQEIRAFVTGWINPEAQARYAALLQEVQSGEVSEAHAGTLEGLLEIVLESGRARTLYGPPGENTLTSLFHKTPHGSALVRETNAVNQALKGLEEQALRGVTFRSAGPGSWALTLQTDRCELTVRIDRRGVRVDTLGVDFG